MEVAGDDDRALLLLEVVPGTNGPVLSTGLVDDLLRVNSLFAGEADDGPHLWRQLIECSLVEGLDGYCEHRSLQAFSEQTRKLLDRIRATGRSVDWGSLPADDLVHYDFHLGNVLSVDGQQVSAIVDWDAVRTGDRLLDLAVLAFTSMWRADEQLVAAVWDHLHEMGDEQRRSAYLHHTVLRLVDWTIRHNNPSTAHRTIAAAEKAFASLECFFFFSCTCSFSKKATNDCGSYPAT